jgi:hypothetical protein
MFVLIPQVDGNLKDWIQILSWLGAIGGILLAIVNYVSQQRLNRRQRELELEQSKLALRWKQAEAAKKILDEMRADENAASAMKMLDWNDVEFEVAPGKREVIWEKDYVKALRTKNLDFTEKEMFTRNCFDSLFYYMARMEHYVKSDLVLLEDVAFPLDYYLNTMKRNHEVFENFLTFYGQDRARNFIKRLANDKPNLLPYGDKRL